MDLSVEEVIQIKRSYAQLCHSHTNIARCFYTNLFEMEPLIKPMFTGDQDNLEMHFNELLFELTTHLDNTDLFSQRCFELGVKHKQYGVQPNHFGIVQAALLLAIEYELKGQCSTEILNAWTHYIDNISKAMISGLHSV